MCGRRESNPYASRHQILSLACLPISTRPRKGILNEKADFHLLFLVAGVGFEPHDLRVMSPTSYQLLYPAILDYKYTDIF